MVYEAVLQLEQEGTKKWCQEKSWKIPRPLRIILTLWLAMSNKFNDMGSSLETVGSMGPVFACYADLKMKQILIFFSHVPM